jgi:hypothetical protein
MSVVSDKLIELAEDIKARRKAREERMKHRVKCPYCGEKVGRCKMVIDHIPVVVMRPDDRRRPSRRPHEVRGSAASNACFGAL